MSVGPLHDNKNKLLYFWTFKCLNLDQMTCHHHRHHRVASPVDAANHTRYLMLVNSALNERRPPDQYSVKKDQIRGQPDRQFQSLGKGTTQALRTRLWSMNGSACAMWPNNLKRMVQMMCISGGYSVFRLITCHQGQKVDNTESSVKSWLIIPQMVGGSLHSSSSSLKNVIPMHLVCKDRRSINKQEKDAVNWTTQKTSHLVCKKPVTL